MNTRPCINPNSVKPALSERQAPLGNNRPPVVGAGLEHIYRQRARQFAARAVTASEPSDSRRVLTFTVGNERLCLDLALVAEILPYAKCSPIPGASRQLLGVINVRGRIWSVIDLSAILELPDVALHERGYIVLVRRAGFEVGLRADKVDQIEMVTRNEFEGQDGDLGALSPRYVTSRTASRVAVLNIEAVFSHPVFLPNLQAGGTPPLELNIEGRPTRVAAVSRSERIFPGGSLA